MMLAAEHASSSSLRLQLLLLLLLLKQYSGDVLTLSDEQVVSHG